MGGFFYLMLLSLLKDRLFVLLGLWGLFAFVIARWVLSGDSAFMLVAQFGYWVILVNFVLFGAAIWRLSKETWARWAPGKPEIWGSHTGADHGYSLAGARTTWVQDPRR